MKRKYALCGASGRGYGMYARQLMGDFAPHGDLVAIFDINGMRATYVRDQVDGSHRIPVYTDFDAMLAEAKPDCVIVVTMDSSHHEYCVRALDAGCDVICEKPMTIDAEKTRAILEAEKRNNRRITVTFNARYSPYHVKIKELLQQQVVGRVLSVDMEWLLDQVHGADYFRRWHKWQRNSGGLLITKATHHFDMINWWIEQDPVTVYANGSLDFYGPQREARSVRCKGCPHYKRCELAMDGFDDIHGTDMEFITKMYFEPEIVDGYMRDQCVFAESDIFDNVSLNVKYSGGALLTYSLNAYMPYEGWRLAVNGTKGRLEARMIHRGLGSDATFYEVEVFTPDQQKATYRVPRDYTTHGGSDAAILRHLFVGVDEDPYHQVAGSREGAMSLLIGAAANLSIGSGAPVRIQDLVDMADFGL